MVKLMASMSTLHVLDLGSCEITTSGWCAFARGLRTRSDGTRSQLKELRVSGNDDLNEEVIDSFARSLKTNTKGITKAFMSVLCNCSSIERTYSSNHTLHKISFSSTVRIPTKLARLLEINRNENKSAVARQKIIAYHFSSDELDSQVFIGMAVPVLPRAVEWIGQDATGFNLMYHVTKGILPTLTQMLNESGNYWKRKEVE